MEILDAKVEPSHENYRTIKKDDAGAIPLFPLYTKCSVNGYRRPVEEVFLQQRAPGLVDGLKTAAPVSSESGLPKARGWRTKPCGCEGNRAPGPLPAK